MIPKVIHYCWFGGSELPKSAKKCIESWKKYCPDYEIIRWDESNYPVEDKCDFVRDAYKQKKWAFVSDYARIDIVNRYGGVYLDIDVELISELNSLLIEGRGFWGFEKNDVVNSGLGFASNKENDILIEIESYYKTINFKVNDMEKIACPIINTNVLKKRGLLLNGKTQVIDGFTVFDSSYLCPYNIYSGKCDIRTNTVSIHHYNSSWMTKKSLYRMRMILFVKKILPSKYVVKIQEIIRKNRG